MIIPNYHSDTLVNVISSILHGYDCKNKYKPLWDIASEVKKAKVVVLLVLDGLGKDMLPHRSFLRKNLHTEITSVFPSATTAAMTTLLSGLSPKEHGLLAWDMYLREIGTIAQIRPFKTRLGEKIPLTKEQITWPNTIFDQIPVRTHWITMRHFLTRPFTAAMKGKSTLWGIKQTKELFSALSEIINKDNQRKFIFAYWETIDELAHQYGKRHAKTKEQIKQVDTELREFCSGINNKDVLILVTADHGHIQTTRRKTIVLNRYKEFVACLSHPVCGEPRAAICYVKPEKCKSFEAFVEQKLKRYCTLHKANDLVDYFGLGTAHAEFNNRSGDYILLPRSKYVLRYYLTHEEREFTPGNHGGISKEEMIVPLVKIKPNT